MSAMEQGEQDTRDLDNYHVARSVLVDKGEAISVAGASLDLLTRSDGWAYEVAKMGKDFANAEDPDFHKRGVWSLRYASGMYEEVVVNDIDQDWILDVVTERYLDVADLQDEAGDSEGARETVLRAGQHMVKIASRELDDDRREQLDLALGRALIQMGSVNSPAAQEMLRSMQQEDLRRRTVLSLTEGFAAGLIAAGQVDTGFRILSSSNIRRPDDLWCVMERQQEEGRPEAANEIIDGITQYFPEYFMTADNLTLGWNLAARVLYQAGRDDLLHEAFLSLPADDRSSLRDLATMCGFAGEAARLTAITDGIVFSPEENESIWALYKNAQDHQSRQSGSAE